MYVAVNCVATMAASCAFLMYVPGIVRIVWSADAEVGYKLTVLHTNDVHAHFLPFNRLGVTCNGNSGEKEECFGGVARLETKIKQIIMEDGNTILLDAGDQFQGTLFYSKYKEEVSRRFMNHIGYHAMAVGNHEFDDGPCTLADFVRGAHFPVLSANIDEEKEPCLAGLINPYAVIVAGGEKIGVVGYTTEDLPTVSTPGNNVTVNGIEASIRPALDELKKMGITKIIGLSHAGVGRDQEVAKRIDGIDIIVSGHSHTFLSNTDASAEGPYPIVMRSPSGAPVLMVSSGAWGKHLGRLDVTFDGNGVPTAWEGGPILIDSSVPPDSSIEAEVAELNKPLEELQKKTIGSSKINMEGTELLCRMGECPIGNLVADAMLWAAADRDAQIAFTNGGGIRAGIPAGDISRGRIIEVLPFGNTLSYFEMRGADIKVALENSVSRADNPMGGGTGRFLHVSGLRYTWNPDLPTGARVVKVEARNQHGTFEPIKSDSHYKVVTNSFLRRGGDGYTVFVEKAINPQDDGPTLDEAVAGYIAAYSPVAPQVEGRITRGK